MADDDGDRLELYKLYLSTIEKVSDRRANANAWMLSVNSALVALYGFLGQGKSAVEGAEKEVWLVAIPIAGFLVCVAWAALLSSYRSLNSSKFKVLLEKEAELKFALFSRENHFEKESGRRSLSRIERWVPWSFGALYVGLVVATLV